MKSQKGITLMSLLVYVVAFLIVIGIVGTITTFFYTNYSFLDKKSTVAAEYSKLNLTLSEENKTKGVSIYNVQNGATTGILSPDDINDHFFVNTTYENQTELLEAMDSVCEQFFNTYVLFDDSNVVGWRKDEKVIYFNQSVLCNEVENFSLIKAYENNHTVLNVYVEFSNKSFNTKYTF